MFILDTDVLSNLRKPKKHPLVQSWLFSLSNQEIATTVISIAEIQCGIEKAKSQHPDYVTSIQAWMDGFLQASGYQIFPLGLDAAVILAKMHKIPALRHFLIRDPRQKSFKSPADLAIAAIAVAEKAVIATGNQSHFAEINAIFPLPGLYNPFTNTLVVSRPPG